MVNCAIDLKAETIELETDGARIRGTASLRSHLSTTHGTMSALEASWRLLLSFYLFADDADKKIGKQTH